MKHTESQRTRLKQHFDSGKSVTRLTAFIDLGICELSSRIGELEKSGYAVAREMIKVTNRFGEEVKVMKYSKRKSFGCPVYDADHVFPDIDSCAPIPALDK